MIPLDHEGFSSLPTRLPRLNVTVTEEQHALLLELAKLTGGSGAGFIRQMLDQATPLLRATVPALRLAAEEMNTTKAEAGEALAGLLHAIADAGVAVPPDLFDQAKPVSAPAPGVKRTERSEVGRAKSGKSS